MATFKKVGYQLTGSALTTIYTVPASVTSAVILSVNVVLTRHTQSTGDITLSWEDGTSRRNLVMYENFSVFTSKNLTPSKIVLNANDTLKVQSNIGGTPVWDITVSVLEV